MPVACTLLSPTYLRTLAPNPYPNLSFPVCIYIYFTPYFCFPEPSTLSITTVFSVNIRSKKLLWGVGAGRNTGRASTSNSGASSYISMSMKCYKSTLELLCLSQGIWRLECRYIWEKDTNDMNSNLECLGWDLTGTLTTPQFALCTWCQGYGSFPWASALKDQTVEFH